MCCDILGRRIQHEKYDTHAREESMNEPQTRATEQPYYFSYQYYWYYLGTLLVCVAFPSIIVGVVPGYKANERAYFLSHVLPIRVSALWIENATTTVLPS